MKHKIFIPILFLIILSLVSTSCNYSEDNITADDVIISLSHSPQTTIANGVNKVVIAVELPNQTIASKRSVSITTTKGLFEIENKNSVTISAVNVVENGEQKVKAFVTLVSGTEEGDAIIKASIDNFSKTETITFTRSFPDQINILTDKINYVVNNTNEIAVTVQLSKNKGEGNISQGQQILSLDAYDSANSPIGQFRNKTTNIDSSGKCINYFSLPAGNPYLGQIKFKATVLGADNQLKTGENNINVVIKE
jgi:hypothetical protein